jgi:hypothetical protein
MYRNINANPIPGVVPMPGNPGEIVGRPDTATKALV